MTWECGENTQTCMMLAISIHARFVHEMESTDGEPAGVSPGWEEKQWSAWRKRDFDGAKPFSETAPVTHVYRPLVSLDIGCREELLAVCRHWLPLFNSY